jgi:hypothetical protein
VSSLQFGAHTHFREKFVISREVAMTVHQMYQAPAINP